MIEVFHSVLPVFLIVALGWVLRRYEVVPEQQWEGIELLGFWVLFPTLLFPCPDQYRSRLTDLEQPDRRVPAGPDRTASSVVSRVARATKAGYRRRRLQQRLPDHFPMECVHCAGGDEQVRRAEGLARVALIMALTVVPLNVINILVLAHTAAGKPAGWGSTMATTARNPIIWGALGGLVCNLAGVPVYEPLLVSVDIIAQAGLGIGLLAVGAGLRIRSIFRPRREMWIGVGGKMLLFPLLVGVACLVFGIRGIELAAAVTCAAVPTAMNGYIMARKMGGDAPLYATTSAAQALLGLVSIPAFLWLAWQMG